MKIIQIIGAVALLGIGLTACSDDYLEIKPQDLPSDLEFFSTPEHAQQAVNGAYDALSYGNFLAGHCQFLSELMADNINVNPAIMVNADWQAHATWTTDIFLGTTSILMQDGYKGSGRANYILDNIDKITGLSDTDKKRMIAECKFIRAICYFEMLRMYAQPWGFTADNSHNGVVIRTKFGIDAQGRSTVKECYDLIIKDLTEAAADLPQTAPMGRATRWSAQGYLAKVYFQQNNFTAAAAAANDVINSNQFELDTAIGARYLGSDSKENVFALVSTDYDIDNVASRFRDVFRLNVSTNTASAYMSSSAFTASTIDPSDKRGQQWYQAIDLPTGPAYVFKKFPTERDQGLPTVPIVSLTELKLIRAEATAELNGSLEDAARDVRDVITRAGASPNLPAERSLIITQARDQRRIEFAGEGNRLHELKRIAVRDNSNLRVRGIAPWNCPGMICQFPAGELQANRDIEPNPTGGCQ
jgi:starch-binding outer membrane protein, SusD/RagB family